MSKEAPKINWILYLIIGLVVSVVLFRLLIMLRFAFIPILAVGAIYGVFYLIRQRRRQKAYEASIEGQIDRKLEFCRKMVDQNRKELSDIQYNSRELQAQLNDEADLNKETWKELKRLSDGFAAEHKLRQTKIDFFQACITKLERLKKNHEVARDLEIRQSKLKELREGQLEALAEMESLRSDLEYDQAYLETIDKLSLRLLDSQSAEQAKGIQRELEEINRELGN
ncbi:MAG: hypothetical protein KDC34_13565 [Saprospiraceae bacterium]|nr:hypothetical protein [Saprospiraceae bacterium]